MRMNQSITGYTLKKLLPSFPIPLKNLIIGLLKWAMKQAGKSMEPLYISKFALILVSLGATAGIMLLNRFIPFKETAQIVIFLLFSCQYRLVVYVFGY